MRGMLRQTLSWPALTAAALLLTGNLVLPHVLRQLGVVLTKKAVPLRAELEFLTPRFGTYELAGAESLSPDVEKGIGTPHFISWLFADRSQEGEGTNAGRGLRLHVAYYTGTADTVPHVPELCYVASGVTALASHDVTLPLEGMAASAGTEKSFAATTANGSTVNLPSCTIPATEFKFKPRGSQKPTAVYYFFIVNGRFFGTKTGVRLQAFDVRDRYSYYCKVEVMAGTLMRDPKSGHWAFNSNQAEGTDAAAAVSRFLSVALPEIMLCLPDWSEVKAGRYPQSQ